MYLGNTPIEVDLSTAIYMLQQKDNMPEGMAWGNFFPAVINHTNSSILTVPFCLSFCSFFCRYENSPVRPASAEISFVT